ncbi:MAG: putative toxin-antitoxin system toxin component, PIN family [Candidatus Acidiferrum sp.]
MQYHDGVALAYVLDTSVIVAALRSSLGASRQLLLGALTRRFELLLSVPLLLEYEAVLTRPDQLSAFGIGRDDVERVLDDVASVARPVRLSYRWRPQLPDAKDDMVLETAINGNADAVVTFNQADFAGLSEGFDCRVLLPGAALRELRGKTK